MTWALGGVLFGWVADRVGRKRALFATIALYAAGTGLCALVTNIGQLIACRVIAGLGIGGEWGIGAALVAEAVPEGRRVEAGVIMQTASPLGVVLASAANYQIAGVWFAADPQSSWRYVFLGGLLGAFAAVPLARGLGRRPMFIAYFLFSALALGVTFGLELAPHTRLAMLSMVGAGVYGIFGAFTFYLPELFPARLRATGAGFCYNIGRILAAGGPFVVGLVSATAGGSSAALMHVLSWLALVPLAAALVARFAIVETRGRALPA